MRQVPLWFPFSLACFIALFGTAFSQEIKLLAFSPFLAILYNRASFQKSLWVASLCGLVIDLFSSECRLGVHALNYCAVTVLLYRQKKHFYEDKPLALCLFTYLISIVSSILQLLLMSLFAGPLPLKGKLLMADVVAMPVLDAIYAYVWFCLPILLYMHIKKMGWRALYNKVYSKLRPKKDSP